MVKTALGRGLNALLAGASPAGTAAVLSASPPMADRFPATPVETGERIQKVPLTRLHASPLQPRKEFPAETLRELADSIREQGILQPLLVRPRGDDFELIAGERRWRAAQLLGLKEVPVLVRAAEDPAALELMLIENLQREDLNPMDEAQGYAQLIQQFQLRQEEAALKVGRSRAAVANALRLLKLPEPVQAALRDGRLSVGHAKVLLGLDAPAAQQAAAEQVLSQGLNVRQTEALVAAWPPRVPPAGAAKSPASPPDVHVADLERRLQERLGTRVQMRYHQGKGVVHVFFFTDDDLDRLLELLGVKAQ